MDGILKVALSAWFIGLNKSWSNQKVNKNHFEGADFSFELKYV